jgi:hypothetical protein
VPRGLASLLLTLLLAAGLCGATPAQAQTPIPSSLPYPHLANMFWQATIDSTIITALAKWDVVVVNSVWTNAQLATLRQLNPNIHIYFYVIVYTVELPPASGDPWKLENYQYALANDMWWYDKNGGVGSDWPNTRMCNITQYGPAGPQGTYRQYIAARIEQLVASHPDLDGVFLDNFWQQLSWEQVFRQLDSDCNPTHNPAGCNGVADSNAHLDSLWNTALRSFAIDLRGRFDVLQASRPRPLAILTNNATDYFESLNGAMVEYFPSGHSNVDYDNPYGYNWYEEMLLAPGGYLPTPFRTNPYTLSVLNGDYYGTLWTPARSPDYERLKRFTLVSSLLGDGFYCLDAGQVTGHSNLWWEPEYDHAGRGKGYLGQPLGPMVRLLQPTGPEILQNGSFTTGMDSWAAYPFGATGAASADGATFHSAPSALRVDVSAVTSGGEFKVWQTPLPLVQHQTYTLSFWARASSTFQLMAHFYSDSCPGSRCWNDHRFWVTPEWQRFEVSFSSNTTATAALNLFVRQPVSVWLDDFSLRTGDTGLFRRDFQHGAVLLNYTNVSQTTDLGGTYWRLRVPGSAVWNGARVTEEIVPPSDGRIVMRDSIPPLPDTTGVSDVAGPPAARNELRQNEPNPFNPSTRIVFTLAHDERAQVALFDVAGRRVRLLLDMPLAAGVEHVVRWDGRDGAGQPLASGVYFYRLETPSFSTTRKMVLLR